MLTTRLLVLPLVLTLGACAGAGNQDATGLDATGDGLASDAGHSDDGHSDAGHSDDGDSDATDGGVPGADKRGKRYCEVLLGTLRGDSVHIGVYNTEGLNDCPEAAWSLLDPAALKSENQADLVVLNGPRYWMLDGLEGSQLIDATVHSFGGIEMRLAGAIDLPTADLVAMSKPYVQHTIHRNSAFHWLAGRAVYELLDPGGQAYVMQAYSVQKSAQTVDTLAGLGATLALPTGWTFRTRTLDADLVLLANQATAVVVQDELGNTYSREN